MKLLLIILTLFSINSYAYDYHLVDLDELSIDYKNYSWINSNARNMLIYPEPPKEGINLNINTTMLRFGYFNSIVEALTTSGQYRGIGLQLSLGIHITDYIDIGYYHHSQHVIDRQIESIPIFPVEDAVQIKLYFYRKNNKDNVL